MRLLVMMLLMIFAPARAGLGHQKNRQLSSREFPDNSFHRPHARTHGFHKQLGR
jgi:hypothetical protein